MTINTFIIKNALRNQRRAALTIMSVAASLFLLVSLLVVKRELTMPPEDAGAALRVAVRNKVSLGQALPARQRPIIEKIPGVEAVTPFSWYGGIYKAESFMTFAQFAMDPKMLRPIFGEAKMAEGAYEAFEAERTACIIGKVTADKYGMKVGDKIKLTSEIYANTMEFKIVGIYAGTTDDRNLFFNQKYLDEATGNLGQVGTWWVKVRTAEDMPQVIEAINQAFANTSAEVRAESERAFQLGFVSMWANIKTLVAFISSVVVFALVLVSASTMSMAVRERFRELAILKALGYRRRELYTFILAESFGLCAAGALLGIGWAWLFYTRTGLAGQCLLAVCAGLAIWALIHLVKREWLGLALCALAVLVLGPFALFLMKAGNIAGLTNNFFVTFEVTPRIIGSAALVAAVLGIVASLGPTLSVARTSVVQGLKTID